MIGAPNAMTGGFGEAGLRVVSGLEIAVDQINGEGGIKSLNGAKLRLVAADTADNPTQATSVTQRLITQNKAVMLVGANTSAMTLSAQIEAERAEVPLLTTSYADQVVERGLRYTFKLPPQGSALADLGARYIIDIFKTYKGTPPNRVAFYSGSDAASQSQLKAAPEFAKKYNLNLVSTVSFATGLTDPTALVSASLQNRPDVIFLSSFTADVILVTRALRAVGITAPIITGGGGIATDATGSSLGKAANGLMGIVCWMWDLPVDGVKFVTDRYHALNPNAPFPPASETIGTGYSLGLVIRAALESGATRDPKTLRDVIAGLDVSAPMPGGHIAFDTRGQNKDIVPIMVSWIDGQLRTVWPKEFQSRPPIF
ncbi:MAG: ABC transporter substrate-binding protein [Methylobacteriaceae bacterium]|nr:ABC transporter substrate-binding protein [Methylobacteriaceae bacterium]